MTIIKTILLGLFFIISSPALSGTLVLGLNLEFIDADFNKEGFDGGLGFQAGYEFKEVGDWDLGFQFEIMNGLYSESELDVAGEMMYESKSLFATARPLDWPVVFKAGLVDAEYKILLQDNTQNFRSVDETGYAYGVALSFGDKSFRYNVLEVKKVKIGNDNFTSFGITVAILGH